ncbi:MAG: threonine-phosphate decarboxylase CobD [Alphaproteobacteria bacterium]
MTGKVMPDDIYHGGDLDRARARWGEPDGGWLDLSTGINPEPYPVDGAEGADFASLPQPVACEKLMAAAAAYYGVPDPALVVPAPGTQAVIQWLPRLCPPGPVAINGPTYGGYTEPWRAAGHGVTMALDLAHATENAATVILANPNNPDGRRVQPAELGRVAKTLAARGGRLIVDEAFADTEPALSAASLTGTDGLVILRSFGKFFGLAGLRLGFALAPADLAMALRGALGPWAVSGPALAIGTKALADRSWIAATRARLGEGRANLDDMLVGAGLKIIGGTDLFRLVEDEAAPDLFQHLGHAGIFARHFTERPHWLRFGLPPTAGVPRLEAALKAWRQGVFR